MTCAPVLLISLHHVGSRNRDQCKLHVQDITAVVCICFYEFAKDLKIVAVFKNILPNQNNGKFSLYICVHRVLIGAYFTNAMEISANLISMISLVSEEVSENCK